MFQCLQHGWQHLLRACPMCSVHTSNSSGWGSAQPIPAAVKIGTGQGGPPFHAQTAAMELEKEIARLKEQANASTFKETYPGWEADELRSELNAIRKDLSYIESRIQQAMQRIDSALNGEA